MPRKKPVPEVVQAPSPTTLKLTHTRLLVEKIDECYKFYRDVLSLRPRFDGEGSVYAEFDAAGHTLALFSRELMNRVTNPSSPAGRANCDDVVITFEVADVDATYAALKLRGVVFVTEPHDQKDWQLRVAHFRDPDGHLLEINSAPKPETPRVGVGEPR